MTVQSAANTANVPFILTGISYAREAETIAQDAARSIALAFGTVMGKILVAAGAVTADVGNTGDGTVTSLALAGGNIPIDGDWNLEVITAPAAAGTVTPDGGNTGDGAAGAATLSTGAIAGTYTLTCIEAIANSGRFEVVDPNGNRLEDLYVAVAYTNTHFALTIADGATDFIVGDIFTMAVTGDGNGVFKLEDPNSNIIDGNITTTGGAGGVTNYSSREVGLSFTITDGATDFIVGDKFELVVTAVGKWGALDVSAINGLQFPAGVYLGAEVTAAAIVAADIANSPMLVGAACTVDSSQLVTEGTGITVDTVLSDGQTISEALAKLGIFDESTIAIDNFENA
jgi:hypothetical protein